jgi:lysophospholipase
MSATAQAERRNEGRSAISGAHEEYSTRLCPAANALSPPGGRVVSLTAADGVRLRAAFWPARVERPRGTVSVLPGRAEFIEKYGEVVDELLARGFAVAVLDLRGQGGSQRELADPLKGHVDDFSLYTLDIAALESGLLAPFAPRPWFGLAHSMAACACLLAAQADALPFERLVACAPLIQIYSLETARAPRLLAASLDALGLGGAYIPGGGARSALLKPFPGNALTSDERRYARNAALAHACPGLALGDPTIGWVAACFRAVDLLAQPETARRVAAPTLALLAGEDRVVSSRAAENFLARMKVGLALTLPGARHEILMETDAVREQFWAAFDAFIPGSGNLA